MTRPAVEPCAPALPAARGPRTHIRIGAEVAIPLSDQNGQHRIPAAEVALVMGSQSDWAVMGHALTLLQELEIASIVKIVSAHRTPDRLYAFARGAKAAGLKVILAGAGGAAHLPGMIAAMTTLPVLGVPVPAGTMAGLDSLLSIVQMPAGVPVGTLAIGEAGARNAALLAAAILALGDADLALRLEGWRARQTAAVPDAPHDEPATGA